MIASNSAINLLRAIGGTAAEMAQAAALGWRADQSAKIRRNTKRRRAAKKVAKASRRRNR